MKKNFLRSKITILSVAILTAILSLSIAIFGMVNKDKNDDSFMTIADTDNYLLKDGEYYTSTWNNYSLKVRMYDKYELSYYVLNEKYGWDEAALTIHFSTAATYYESGKKIGSYDVGGHYDITSTTLNYCEVHNDYGKSLFDAFKSNGKAVIPCRHTLTGTWLGAGWADKDEKTTYSKFSLTNYSLDGAINITVDGVSYTKYYHWSGGVSYSKGDEVILQGNDNFYIYNEEALKLYAYELVDQECTSGISEYSKVYLQDNLDMSRVSNMIPIGNSSVPFRGTFDGNEYTISNFDISHSSAYTDLVIGLFPYVRGATITSLCLSECNIAVNSTNTSTSSPSNSLKVGILVGQSSNYGTSSIAKTQITNCMVIDSSIEVKGAPVNSCAIGGLVGFVQEQSSLIITNCRSTVDLKVTGSSYGSEIWIGGLVGVFETTEYDQYDLQTYNELSVTNSYFYGDVLVSQTYTPSASNSYRTAGAHITIGGILAEATRHFVDNYKFDGSSYVLGETINAKITIKSCFAKFNNLTAWTSTGSNKTVYGYHAYEYLEPRIFTVYNISSVLKKSSSNVVGGLTYSGNYTDHANSKNVKINVLSGDAKSCSNVEINATNFAHDPYSMYQQGNNIYMPADVYTFGATIDENIIP